MRDTETSHSPESEARAAAADEPGHDETFPVAAFDDPHLQPAAEHVRRAEGVTGLLLMIGVAGFALYGAAYWQSWNDTIQGLSLGIGFFAFGFGLSSWGKYLLPQGPFVEQRHSNASTEEEVDAMAAAVVGRGKMVFRRRGFLGSLLGAGATIMGVVLVFPLLRSLGPVPKQTFDHTKWKPGSRVVDITGRPITVDDVVRGGSLTVFPEGYPGDAMAQTILVRPSYTDIVTAKGRETWAPKGNLAFSKVCTHAGCPVGLYMEQTEQLLCPCHQSLFDVGEYRPAVPVFGPAPRPLPQLPLMVDAHGYLRAQADYDQPVGPGFWERS